MRRKRLPSNRQAFWNRLPWVLNALFWWSILGVIVTRVDPSLVAHILWPYSYLPFFGVLFLALGFSMYAWRGTWLPPLVWTLGIGGFLILRLYGMGQIVNLLLIGGVLAAFEVYFKLREPVSE